MLQAERAEKERVKRLTLDINERLEEEDYQEMLAQVITFLINFVIYNNQNGLASLIIILECKLI